MKPSIKEISRASAEHFGITLEMLMGDNTKRKFAWPRQVAMFLSREMSGRSLTDIAKLIGRRDHTTILYGYREVERAAEGKEVLADLMAVAAQATAYARARAERERGYVQELYAGRSLVVLEPPMPVARSNVTRRVMVPARASRWPVLAPLGKAMPSDLKPPTRAQLMGARA